MVNRKINHDGIIRQAVESVNLVMGEVTECDVLRDESTTGKDKPWAKHKLGSVRLATLYEKANEIVPLLSERRLDALANCGDWLEFVRYSDGTQKFRRAYFCKLRLCPMCQWRRSLKLARRLHDIVERISATSTTRFIFVTLTQRNVAGEKLGEELGKMTAAFSSLMRRKPLKDVTLGWCRSIEVTVNARDFTFHPHIHALVAVKAEYFRGRGYVKQARWRELWQDVMKLSYLPQVNVKAIDSGVTVELAKYCSKGLDALAKVADGRQVVETLIHLHKALANRRLITFAGVFSGIAFADDDLTDDSESCACDGDSGVSEVGWAIYRWTPRAGVYVASAAVDSYPPLLVTVATVAPPNRQASSGCGRLCDGDGQETG